MINPSPKYNPYEIPVNNAGTISKLDDTDLFVGYDPSSGKDLGCEIEMRRYDDGSIKIESVKYLK